MIAALCASHGLANVMHDFEHCVNESDCRLSSCSAKDGRLITIL